MGSRNIFTRRHFLQTTGAALALPLILPASARGANDVIRLAYIGVGRRAQELMQPIPGTEVVAAADVFQKRLDAFKKKFPAADLYQDYREMLAREDIQGVIIASPDHWHALHSIHAMRAGKDVYVEKPMTLTIREGQVMTQVARETSRICQVGAQQRSNPKNHQACELIRNGRIGKVTLIHGSNYPSPWECPLGEQPVPEGMDWDMWCGPTEPRPFHEELYLPRVRNHEAGWISYRSYSGGEITGWGAHGLDQMQWALGMDETGPTEIEPLLDKIPPDDGEHKGPTCQLRYKYASGTEIILDGEGPGGGGIFEGEDGSITVNRGVFKTSFFVDDDPIENPEIPLYDVSDKTVASSKDDTARHLGNWVYCMRTRETPISDVAIGHRATTLCHLGNIARWTQRKLQWDPVAERFVNDDDANTYLDRTRRAPWQL